jgi:hypothetical protein
LPYICTGLSDFEDCCSWRPAMVSDAPCAVVLLLLAVWTGPAVAVAPAAVAAAALAARAAAGKAPAAKALTPAAVAAVRAVKQAASRQ